MNNLVKAMEFASLAHKDQRRKYTNEPYINHPISVCKLVSEVKHTEEMLISALLHDTVEDTEVTIEQIETEFGGLVADYVAGLTDISKSEDGNRKTRKEIDRLHYKGSSPEVQTIKLADLIDNSSTIAKYDLEFAEVYMREKRELMKFLEDGSDRLYEKAMDIIMAYYLHRY